MRRISDILFKEIHFISELALSIITISILFIIYFVSITPGFETNDDALMMMISSGMLTGEPSEYLFFINILICLLLKALYIQWPAFSWYVFFLYSVHIVAMTVLLYVFLKLQKNLCGLMFFVILFIFFELRFLTYIQFTTTAFIVGFCGIILFHQTLNESVKNNLVSIIIAFLLLSVAMLIRNDVFIGILLVWLPVLIITYLKNRKIRIPVFVLCALIAYFALLYCDGVYYKKNLDRFNINKYKRAADYIANGPLKTNDATLFKVGWSENDIILFQHWFWVDNKVFTEDKIFIVGNELKSHRQTKQAFKLLLFELFKAKRYVFSGFLCLVLIFVLLPKRQLPTLAILVLTVLTIYLGLSFLSRIPERIALSFMCFACIFGFYTVLGSLDKEKVKKRLIFCIFLIIFFLLVLQIFKTIRLSEINQANNKHYIRVITDVSKEKDSLFVIAGPDFPYECIPIFENPQRFCFYNILPTCWAINTPVYNKILERFRIDSLLSSLYEKNNIYILSTGWLTPAPYQRISEQYSIRDLLRLLYGKDNFFNDKSSDSFYDSLKVFYREHYGIDIIYRDVDKGYSNIKPVKITPR